MRLRTRKLVSPELTRDGDNSRDRALDQLQSEAESNKSADVTVNNSSTTMGQRNRDVSVISAALGGYGFPSPSSYDDESWDSDTMLLAWAPWFNSATLEQEYVVPQYAVDGWLPGRVLPQKRGLGDISAPVMMPICISAMAEPWKAVSYTHLTLPTILLV